MATPAVFSVLILTAPPPGQAAEGGGAYVKIDGREALLRTVELFLNRDNIKQIQLAVLPDDLEEAKRKYGAHLGFSGVKLVSGGPRWIDQIATAGRTISADATHVLVHDAARPAVPFTDIDAILEAAETSEAAVLYAPLRTALVEVDEGLNAVAVHAPSRFVQLLTPQVYSRKTFDQTLGAGQEPHASAFKLVKGSPLNVRLGSGAEASLAKAMLHMLPKPKVRAPSSPFEEAQW